MIQGWVAGILGGIVLMLGGIFGVATLTKPAAHQPPHVSAATTTSQTQTTTDTSSGDSAPSKPASSSPTTEAATSTIEGVATHSDSFDIHAIPLGDGNVSSSPKVGYVYSCTQTFNGGGAEHAGDWIQGSVWDMTKKISVEGSVSWPSATFSTYFEGVQRLLKGDGLPVGSKTGIFPIARTDPAYTYDRNPNSITAYTVSYLLPASPVVAANASCVPMGAIGYALNGVAIYNALDDAGRDAVAHEVQDTCDGHPQGAGQYHYHGPSPCMPHVDEENAVVGFALDGFPITSLYGANGKIYTNADLDACHGMTSTIMLDGKEVTTYHYVLTEEYPYTVGCFRGTPVRTGASAGERTQPTSTAATTQGPPQAAIDACVGKTTNSACSFSTQKGTVSGTCKTPPGSSLACVP